MQLFLKAIIFLLLLCQFTPCQAGRCTGSAYCSACKNCSACKHCSGGGGTCGVCGGGDSYRKKSKSSYGTTTPGYKSNHDNSGSSYESGASTQNTISTYNYPVEEKKGSHTIIWIVLVLLVLYLLFNRKNKS